MERFLGHPKKRELARVSASVLLCASLFSRAVPVWLLRNVSKFAGGRGSCDGLACQRRKLAVCLTLFSAKYRRSIRLAMLWWSCMSGLDGKSVFLDTTSSLSMPGEAWNCVNRL